MNSLEKLAKKNILAQALNKTAAVSGPVKAYRRYLQMLREGAPMHNTHGEAALGIVNDGLVRTGSRNLFGEGTYWSLGKPSKAFGKVDIVKGSRGDIKKLDPDMVARHSVGGGQNWALHSTSVGTPLGKGDSVVLKNSINDKEIREAARKAGLRVIDNRSQHAAMKTSPISEMMFGRGKTTASKDVEKRLVKMDQARKRRINKRKKREIYNA